MFLSGNAPFFVFTIYVLRFTIKKVRILQISSAKNFGGGERHLLDLSNSLSGRGHELFFAVSPKSSFSDRFQRFPKENIFEINIKNSLDVFGARKLAKFIREKNIEIVHAHLAKDYLPASLAVRAAPQAKLVFTRHVLFSMKSLQKFFLINVDKVIAVSKAVETNLRHTFPPKKIVTIPNGIAIEKRSNVEREKIGNDFRFEHNISFDAQLIGIVGELKLLKGQRDYVLAAQIVAQNFPDGYFIIVGKDNSYKKDFRRELKRLVKVFSLENRFLWLDWLEDTAPLLAALDVFVSASHSESFGLAILEAMGNGKAIVSTETAGAKELLENNRTGKLVPVKEPIILAEAISELLSDENLRQTLGEKARKFADERYSLEKMVIKTENVYREILNR